MRTYLDFEKPVAELEAKVEELRAMAAQDESVSIGDEIARLEAKSSQALRELYGTLTPWQKTQAIASMARTRPSSAASAASGASRSA